MTASNKPLPSEIPIFFSTDDHYIPFLDVAIRSLIENASRSYRYRIIVLNTGLRQESIDTVKQSECEGFRIDFVDISEKIEHIKKHFQSIYHFSVVAYYRLFIASLFPEYDKVIYLDCDLVVLDDISKLYYTDLGDNIIGGVSDEFVYATPEFRRYTAEAVGVDPADYINSGVIVIDLKRFREEEIEEKFTSLITRYNFDTVDPDQAYLNFLCRGRIKHLSPGWNKKPTPLKEGEEIFIFHYALYKKPWQYEDVEGAEYFWRYAKGSPFHQEILAKKALFDEDARAKSEAAALHIKANALRIAESDKSFFKTLILAEE
jgi:lipopolysaccharide biosynthesis glycosyltransferase